VQASVSGFQPASALSARREELLCIEHGGLATGPGRWAPAPCLLSGLRIVSYHIAVEASGSQPSYSQCDVRRAVLWLPPGFFFFLCLTCSLSIQDSSARVFYGVLSVLTGTWLVRCLRAAVIISDDGVILRGQLRTSKYSWDEIEGATVVRMRTASPLADSFPYVNLALQLSGGRLEPFAEMAASAKKRNQVDELAEQIKNRAKVWHSGHGSSL